MYNYKTRADDNVFPPIPDFAMVDYLPDTRAFNLYLHLRQEGSSFQHAYTEAHKDHEFRNYMVVRVAGTNLDAPDPLQKRVQAMTTAALELIWSNWLPSISSADLAAAWYDEAQGISLLEYYMAIDWELSWRRLLG